MSIAGKELCDCGRIATWYYGPGYADGGNPSSCDDCVHRGCSCNHYSVDVNAYHPPLDTPELPDGEEGKDWKWIEAGKVWCYIDDLGREYPCCEYMHSEDGWDKETF
jgi:hypothetical protein